MDETPQARLFAAGAAAHAAGQIDRAEALYRQALDAEPGHAEALLNLAVLRAGYVYLPLKPAYHAAELDYFIKDAEPAVLVCAGKNFGWASKLAFMAGVQNVFTLNEDRSGSLLDRAAAMSDQHPPATRRSEDLAAILYTSGTTGRSKGAMLSHGNLLSNALTLKDLWDWKAGDVLIHALPIFHVHGLFVASHGALLNGSLMLFSFGAFCWAWYYYADWHNDTYTLTTDRLIDMEKKPLLGSLIQRSAPLENLVNVQYSRPGFWASIFNYGSVTIETGGDTGDLDFKMVLDPLLVQQTILNRMELRQEQQQTAERERQRTEMVDWLKAYAQVTQPAQPPEQPGAPAH